MRELKLFYASTHVGAAKFDDDLSDLSLSVTWRLEIPKTLRRSAQGRQDIIAAMLRDDSSSLARCHPYCWISSKIPLRLSRVALRPNLVDLLNHVTSAGFPQPDILASIKAITAEIKRVIFINGDRVDCQTSNLREVI